MWLSRLPAPLRRFFADRFVPHGYAGHERFDRLYAAGGDPWAARSRNARLRFGHLLELVAERAPVDSILDVGCGEGVFTRELTRYAREVVGIDPSPIAIERARRRVPGASFHCATLEAFAPGRRFDLVTAVEMLYYVESVETALEKLRGLGGTVILAYTSRQRTRLDPILDRYGDACRRSVVRFGRFRRGGFTVAVLEGKKD